MPTRNAGGSNASLKSEMPEYGSIEKGIRAKYKSVFEDFYTKAIMSEGDRDGDGLNRSDAQSAAEARASKLSFNSSGQDNKDAHEGYQVLMQQLNQNATRVLGIAGKNAFGALTGMRAEPDVYSLGGGSFLAKLTVPKFDIQIHYDKGLDSYGVLIGRKNGQPLYGTTDGLDSEQVSDAITRYTGIRVS